MYKIFQGFHLVEAYHELKKAKRLAKNQTVARGIKLAVAIVVALVLWFLPSDAFGIEGLTVIEQRLISIFVFATLMWCLKPFRHGPPPYLLSYCCCFPYPTAVCGCSRKAFRPKNWDRW